MANLPLFIISFANNPLNPLSSLKKEELGIKKVIDDLQLYGCDIEVIYPTTREEIVDLLKIETNRERLYLFSYSGHADGDRLVTEEETTYAYGLANLLAECRNLLCVVLNGCSTEKQVFLIQESFKKTNMTTPAIVATSASVGDAIASEFNVHFFQQLLTYGHSIANAFSLAIALINTKTKQPIVPINRFLDEQPQDLGTWGLYSVYNVDVYILFCVIEHVSTPYIPNIKLIKSLIVELRDKNKVIREIFENSNYIIEDSDMGEYKEEIYKCFPYSISRRLQRLDASESTNDRNVAMALPNKNNKTRLEELQRTVNTIQDLLCALIQAEINFYLQNSDSGTRNKLVPQIRHIYIKDINGQNTGGYSFSNVSNLLQLCKAIESLNIPLFISELKELNDEVLFDNLSFFGNLNVNISSDLQVKSLNKIAEARLVYIVKKCLFLAKYKITSVDKILVNRKRDNPTIFHHEVFKQDLTNTSIPNRSKILFKNGKYLDHASTIVHRGVLEESTDKFLNLSPFLIDESLFIQNSTTSNLLILIDAFYDKNKNQWKFELRYLLSNGKQSNQMTSELQVDTKAGTEIKFKNIAYNEIKNEWEHFFNLLV